MIQILPQLSRDSPLTAEGSESTSYFVFWRIRKNHPWRSEEFESRFEAHGRYFSLLDQGRETYFEKRRYG